MMRFALYLMIFRARSDRICRELVVAAFLGRGEVARVTERSATTGTGLVGAGRIETVVASSRQETSR